MSEALDLGQFAGSTPGPWFDSFDELGGEECRSAAYLIRSMSRDIATVDIRVYLGGDAEWEDRHRRHPEAQANARLLAAAPALLAEVERLRGLLTEARGHVPSDPPLLSHTGDDECKCPDCDLLCRIDAALPGGGGQ